MRLLLLSTPWLLLPLLASPLGCASQAGDSEELLPLVQKSPPLFWEVPCAGHNHVRVDRQIICRIVGNTVIGYRNDKIIWSFDSPGHPLGLTNGGCLLTVDLKLISFDEETGKIRARVDDFAEVLRLYRRIARSLCGDDAVARRELFGTVPVAVADDGSSMWAEGKVKPTHFRWMYGRNPHDFAIAVDGLGADDKTIRLDLMPGCFIFSRNKAGRWQLVAADQSFQVGEGDKFRSRAAFKTLDE